MVAVGEMQVPIDEVADVIAVGHGLVAAARAVNMAAGMART